MPTRVPQSVYPLFLMLLCMACTGDTQGPAVSPAPAATPATATPAPAPSFQEWSAQFLEQYWQQYPEDAVQNGRYEFAGELPIPSPELRARRRQFWQDTLAQLGNYPLADLDRNAASDWYVIQKQAEQALWYADRFQGESWDPSQYNLGDMAGFLLVTEYAPLPERLAALDRYLGAAPAYFAQASQNLQVPTVPHTELAIQQNEGTVQFLQGELAEAINTAEIDAATRSAYQATLTAAAEATTAYVSDLQQRLPSLRDGLARDFRLGAELYDEKFLHDLKSGFSAEEVYQRALSEKERLHTEMYALTAQLWPQYFPDTALPDDRLQAIAQLLARLVEDHASPEAFIDEVRDQLPQLQQFIIDKDLLTIDPDKPLVVRPTPEYQRGFAVAGIEAPGPYDSAANTYYNVEPLTDYAADAADSFLREYNRRTMQILNIHEAIPGHYTQLVHANKSPSLIKAVFGNGTMIEGWAVYTERMMLEAGYGAMEPELWLLWYKWNLRVVVNTILDYRIQVEGLAEDAALELLIREAFQEQQEATGKWRRATLSQVQLASYFTGYAEIYALQQAERARLGEAFSLKQFHDTFLSFGSAPIPVIKELMANP